MKGCRGEGELSRCVFCSIPAPNRSQAASASLSGSRRPAIAAELALSQLRSLRGWGSRGNNVSSGNVSDLYQLVLARVPRASCLVGGRLMSKGGQGGNPSSGTLSGREGEGETRQLGKEAELRIKLPLAASGAPVSRGGAWPLCGRPRSLSPTGHPTHDTRKPHFFLVTASAGGEYCLPVPGAHGSRTRLSLWLRRRHAAGQVRAL